MQVPCDTSRDTGRQDATTRHGSAGWFIGGVASGVLLGLIGTGAIVGASALTNPQPSTLPANTEEPCYRQGYTSKAKSKNVLSALFGGLAGTAAWLAIYAANND